ncbi:MAG: hypothetical protein IPK73_26350 [Candidatus Obscuribacter sp.]|nr:hypothetical protein [Candidatus Obscuribacter sp.]
MMRWMLVQSAWSAIRGSSNLRACYSQIGRRRAKNRHHRHCQETRHYRVSRFKGESGVR